LKGDQCICKDGTLHGLVTGLRYQILDQTRELDAIQDKIRTREALLRDIYYWIAKMGFDGTGLQFKKKIRNMLGLD
jgi:hypothetical protein